MKIILLLALVSSCVSRKKINAAIWLNNFPLPEDICEANPDLKQYGFYRKLNTGNFEFMSACKPAAKDWLSMHKDDFKKLMNRATLPDESEKAIEAGKP
jgi:hypothetical protein